MDKCSIKSDFSLNLSRKTLQVVEYWLRRPPGSVAAPTDAGYDFVGGGVSAGVGVDESRMRLREHGYETVADNVNRMPAYPGDRMTGYPGSSGGGRLEQNLSISC